MSKRLSLANNRITLTTKETNGFKTALGSFVIINEDVLLILLGFYSRKKILLWSYNRERTIN